MDLFPSNDSAADPFTTVALQINVAKAEATVHIYASNTAIVHSFY